MLNERKLYLEKLVDRLSKRIEAAPQGSLRINTSNNKKQFFWRKEPGDKDGMYIPRKQFPMAQALAQKDYDKKVLKSIQQELKAIEKYMDMLPVVPMENIYESLHNERQKIVIPIVETVEQYRKRWESEDYVAKEIDDFVPLLYTERGERVRSKSELIIADILNREGIPYRYECPLLLKGQRLIHPDFTVLNIRKRKIVYWEHLGMMDDPEYVRKAMSRIDEFEENGIRLGENLIYTWETKSQPLNPHVIRKKIIKYLK